MARSSHGPCQGRLSQGPCQGRPPQPGYRHAVAGWWICMVWYVLLAARNQCLVEAVAHASFRAPHVDDAAGGHPAPQRPHLQGHTWHAVLHYRAHLISAALSCTSHQGDATTPCACAMPRHSTPPCIICVLSHFTLHCVHHRAGLTLALWAPPLRPAGQCRVGTMRAPPRSPPGCTACLQDGGGTPSPIVLSMLGPGTEEGLLEPSAAWDAQHNVRILLRSGGGLAQHACRVHACIKGHR